MIFLVLITVSVFLQSGSKKPIFLASISLVIKTGAIPGQELTLVPASS